MEFTLWRYNKRGFVKDRTNCKLDCEIVDKMFSKWEGPLFQIIYENHFASTFNICFIIKTLTFQYKGFKKIIPLYTKKSTSVYFQKIKYRITLFPFGLKNITNYF